MSKKHAPKIQKAPTKAPNGIVHTKPTQAQPNPPKIAEKALFVDWIATPVFLRGEIKTQDQFAKKYKVTPATLSDWKSQDPKFWSRVEKSAKRYQAEQIGMILQSVATNIIRNGKGQDAKVWLEYVMNWNPKYVFEDDTPSGKRMEPDQRKTVIDALAKVGLSALSLSKKVENPDDPTD